ncbi:MAG: aminoacyl-tRNA hydrolase [Opitutaceae bacterium]
MRKSIRLIVGLGNPGRDYAETRHNAGFVALDALASKARASWAGRREFESEVARFEQGGETIHLLKPQTFMNESGAAVAAFVRYHRLEPSEVVVVFDEIQLPLGRVKLSSSGSAGGHNGLASVLSHLDGDFVRFRIGVGPRHPPAIDLKDYVLGKFTPEQKTSLFQKIPEILEGFDLLLRQGVEPAMNRVNRRPSNHDRNEENL